MRTLMGLYKAVCLSVDTDAHVISCQVPQIFADETVTCLDLAGGVVPKAGAVGWVSFESGFPDRPVWLGIGEFTTKDIVEAGLPPGGATGQALVKLSATDDDAGWANRVQTVVAGVNVSVVNTNPFMPVVAADYQIPAGGTTNQVLAKNSATDRDLKWYDLPVPPLGNYVLKAGDTMSGLLNMSGAANEIRFLGDAGYVSWYDGGGVAIGNRVGHLQGNNTAGLVLASEHGSLTLNSASGFVANPGNLRVGAMTAYSGFNGLGYSNGQYLIMTDGTGTFISTPSGSGGISLRAAANGGYQFNVNTNGTHGIIGNLNIQGYTIYGTRFELNGADHVYWSAYGGGWYMQDGTWIRATNSKNIYTGGTMQADAGFATGQNVSASAHLGSAGGGEWYYQRAFQCTNNGSRVGVSLLPGGYAINLDALPNNGNFNILNTDSGGYANVYGGAYTNGSQRKTKQDIRPWPAPIGSLGAAANLRSSWDKLHDIEVVSYRYRQDITLRVAMGERRDRAYQRLNDWMARKGAPLYPNPAHQCGAYQYTRSDFDCGGTPDDPCIAYRQWEREQVGAIVEQLIEIFPEACSLDPKDGSPGGVNLGAMIFSVVRALQDLPQDLPQAMNRIRALEQDVTTLREQLNNYLEAA